ncbi:MAG: hypothetical protein H0W99_10150 [Acidobacteria bacterium]|jgi:hypothetical protein|nr:hypothetical protein [Acidobacteriota bacterium]
MTITKSKPVSRRARKCFSQLAVLVAVLILSLSQVVVGADQPVRRIRFKQGTTSARVKGRLRGGSDKAIFVIRVRPGQRLEAEVQSKNYAHVTLVSPSGQPGDEDMQGTHTGVASTEAGDYRIIVTESQKAAPWKGTFFLNVTVL